MGLEVTNRWKTGKSQIYVALRDRSFSEVSIPILIVSSTVRLACRLFMDVL